MTEADFLAEIRRDPAADGPRLTYADWLREQGDEDRYQFIYAQCELARIEFSCTYCDVENRIFPEKTDTCPKCGSKSPGLRRLEAELLAKTTSEQCPRCEREAKRIAESVRNGRIGDITASASLATMGLRCECKGKPVQVSNAVRWAGTLGGREAAIYPSGGQWHLFWPIDLTHGETFIEARFSRGLIGAVSLSCAVFLGEQCGECEGTGFYYIERNKTTCVVCHGSGYVGGCAADLALAPRMVTRVELSDKRPEEHEPPSGIKNWSWYVVGFRDDQATLPDAIFYLLKNGFGSMTGQRRAYPSVTAAQQDLSDACVSYMLGAKAELVG